MDGPKGSTKAVSHIERTSPRVTVLNLYQWTSRWETVGQTVRSMGSYPAEPGFEPATSCGERKIPEITCRKISGIGPASLFHIAYVIHNLLLLDMCLFPAAIWWQAHIVCLFIRISRNWTHTSHYMNIELARWYSTLSKPSSPWAQSFVICMYD